MIAQHLRDSEVAQQAGGQGDLQGEPVLALADVEDVAGVCCAGFLFLLSTEYSHIEKKGGFGG
jgi:hypothetical protein